MAKWWCVTMTQGLPGHNFSDLTEQFFFKLQEAYVMLLWTCF